MAAAASNERLAVRAVEGARVPQKAVASASFTQQATARKETNATTLTTLLRRLLALSRVAEASPETRVEAKAKADPEAGAQAAATVKNRAAPAEVRVEARAEAEKAKGEEEAAAETQARFLVGSMPKAIVSLAEIANSLTQLCKPPLRKFLTLTVAPTVEGRARVVADGSLALHPLCSYQRLLQHSLPRLPLPVLTLSRMMFRCSTYQCLVTISTFHVWRHSHARKD